MYIQKNKLKIVILFWIWELKYSYSVMQNNEVTFEKEDERMNSENKIKFGFYYGNTIFNLKLFISTHLCNTQFDYIELLLIINYNNNVY